jgi:hypothetical protein
MTDEAKKYQDAIRRLHGCESRHLHTLGYKETFQGEVVWDGRVAYFALDGHPTASHCYAFIIAKEDGSEQCFAVLGVPPIESALDAVRAAIASEHRTNRE